MIFFAKSLKPKYVEAYDTFKKKLVDETQTSKPQKNTDTFKQTLTCLFLSFRVNLKERFQCETPCTKYGKMYAFKNLLHSYIFLMINYSDLHSFLLTYE